MSKSRNVSSASQNRPATVTPPRDRSELEGPPSTSNAAGAELAAPEREMIIRSSRTPAVSAHALDDASGLHGQRSDASAPASALGTPLGEEAQVAVLAHRFYEEEGYPEGRALEHWMRAAQEVRGKRGR